MQNLRSHDQLSKGHWDVIDEHGLRAEPVPHRAGHVFPNPASIYGATKLAQEHILQAWSAAKNVPLSIFRLQNVYGPGQSPINPYTGIITFFHQIAAKGNVIEVYEDGMIGRDFIFIGDVVKAIEAAYVKPAVGRRCIDVGTGVANSIVYAAKSISSLYGAPEPVITGKFRDGDVRWAVADVSALQEGLGITASVGFESGMSMVREWLTEEKVI
ncbi:NAD-dependent epimerase/dehydratase family protein [Nitrospirillum sp. BR 11752]|uniref:NAD-dependent epimerase/dehydratase family protein n=1 Tax=Nitrospirillum sp. BR 11752 TaxID=3104293 RepID=UPI002ECDCE51|nr:NAD-dependent epimerase/dehydratase family protein [Nitrospirillum sp. BR 11752]